MQKFSSSNRKHTERKKDEEVVYDSGELKVIKFQNYNIIKEKDGVVCIIYLINENKVILRQEYVPSFLYADGQEYHISLVGGGIEKGETPEEALLREIQEEAGIVIRNDFKLEIEPPLYPCKSHANKYYYSLITLTDNDYHEVMVKGDGSKLEDMSKAVKIDVKYIKHLQVSDMVTQFVIDKMLAHLNIK